MLVDQREVDKIEERLLVRRHRNLDLYLYRRLLACVAHDPVDELIQVHVLAL
jgi:hypothetical protein